MNVVFWSQYRDWMGASKAHDVEVLYLTDDELKQLKEDLSAECEEYDESKDVSSRWEGKIKRAPVRPAKCVTIRSDYDIFNSWDEKEEGDKDEVSHRIGEEVCYDPGTDGTHQG